MGKGLSVAEWHSLTARYVGSCQFVPQTEWEACSMQLNGWAFKCTWFCTAVSFIPTFWVCFYCHTYTWEHYFATRHPFERTLVFQAVIGTVGVHDSSLWGQEAHAAPWLLQAAVAPSRGDRDGAMVSGGWGTWGASARSAKPVAAQCVLWDCLTWIHPSYRLSVLAQASISVACHTFKPSRGCLPSVTHKWLSTILNPFLALQIALVSASLQRGAEDENV